METKVCSKCGLVVIWDSYFKRWECLSCGHGEFDPIKEINDVLNSGILSEELIPIATIIYDINKIYE